MRLGPFDEVGHDQEVTRELHAGDNVEFEGEALLVVLLACRAQMLRDRGKAAGEPRFGLRLQLGRFGYGGIFRIGQEIREDWLARLGPEGAALGDLDRVLDGFRQIGKQSRHLALRLEIMVRREPAPVVFRDVASFRDAKKRVVGVENIALRKIGFVGSDERRAVVISPMQKLWLNRALARRGVPLDLDIEPVAKDRRERREARFGQRCVSGGESFISRAIRAARQGNKPFRAFLKLRQRYMRRAIACVIEKRLARKAHQIAISRCILGENDD